MIMTAVSEKDAVICIHDDYCIDIEAAEISQILLKIGAVSYTHLTLPTTERV